MDVNEQMTAARQLRAWQRRIFVTSWLTYGSIYLCRVNLSVALPAIREQFGWSKSEAGLIGSALLWAYAVGQFINGQLGDRTSARRFVAAGLLASVALNVAFGFAASLPVMVALWAANGYAQSMAWGPIVRTLSRWFAAEWRGRLSALLGPSYMLGHAGSWLLAGWLAARWGWRAAFWAPAALVALSALHWIAAMRDTPGEVGFTSPGGAGHRPGSFSPGWSGVWRRSFAHPRLRWAALTNVAAGFVLGSAALWVPTYLVEGLDMSLSNAAVSAVALPLCGLVGVLIAGWASDRFFRSRVGPTAMVLMAGLAVSMLALPLLAPLGGKALAVALLGLSGAMSYGTRLLLVTVVPLSLSNEGHVSSAAGFVDFAGYVGSGIGGLLIAAAVDRWGWDAMFVSWACVALLGMATIAPTWRAEVRCAAGEATRQVRPALGQSHD